MGPSTSKRGSQIPGIGRNKRILRLLGYLPPCPFHTVGEALTHLLPELHNTRQNNIVTLYYTTGTVASNPGGYTAFCRATGS